MILSLTVSAKPPTNGSRPTSSLNITPSATPRSNAELKDNNHKRIISAKIPSPIGTSGLSAWLPNNPLTVLQPFVLMVFHKPESASRTFSLKGSMGSRKLAAIMPRKPPRARPIKSNMGVYTLLERAYCNAGRRWREPYLTG